MLRRKREAGTRRKVEPILRHDPLSIPRGTTPSLCFRQAAMTGNGGYIPPSPPRSNGATRSSASSSSAPLLRLTLQQERRLWTHIDDRLLSLERDERKHAFGSLSTLITSRLKPLLTLILQIPPVEPWGAVRVSYLLTLTGALMGYTTSLPLITLPPTAHAPIPDTSIEQDVMEESQEDEQVQELAAQAMRTLLDFLGEVDRGWQAVLRGDAWIPPSTPSGKGHAVPVSFGAQVGATERIRLKSIVLASRAKFLSWARDYGDFPKASIDDDSAASGIDESELDQGLEWEKEVIGLWNGTLQKLSDMDFAQITGDEGRS